MNITLWFREHNIIFPLTYITQTVFYSCFSDRAS